MNNYTITSPISGTIIEKAAKVGDALSTGSDLCTCLLYTSRCV